MNTREWRPADAGHVSELRAAAASDPGSPAGDTGEQLAWFTVDRLDDAVVIQAGGELDMLTTPRLRDLVGEQLRTGPRMVVLDLSAVTFFASSGLAALVEVQAAATAGGVPLRLAGMSRSVRRPLQITGLAGRFPSYDDVASALAEPAG